MTIWKVGLLCFGVGLTMQAETAKERLGTAATVMAEIMRTPDKGIPQELLESAQCVVVVPGLKKGAFIVGGKYGKGFMSCRRAAGAGWSAPASMRVEGGSFGFQIGGSETDAVILVMNKRGATKLMESKFTLGADAAVAAGPLGRSTAAKTDAKMQAQILTYSRSRGVFAGVALDGATLRPDGEGNKELYGNEDLSSQQIVMGKTRMPAAARPLIAQLNKYSHVREK
ncbi:MAG: lipid-binding SYLF domain-containing protein [Bryobacteraceae bacterium]